MLDDPQLSRLVCQPPQRAQRFLIARETEHQRVLPRGSALAGSVAEDQSVALSDQELLAADDAVAAVVAADAVDVVAE